LGHVVAVVGLRREAAVLRGLDVVTVAGGGDPERLARELAEAARGADGIISFGMAGALDPALRIGDWVIGTRVLGGFDAACDPAWSAALGQRLPQARRGAVHAENRLIGCPTEKARLFADGAVVADMESQVAARIAAELALPFAVLRCISDEADAALPPAIAVAMKPGGGLALGAVLRSISGNPGQLPALLRAAAGFNRAYAALTAGARQAGQRMACQRLCSNERKEHIPFT
jgi:hopanoid-associated phosphorylase